MGWSVEAQNDFLAGQFGSTRGTDAPDALEFVYFMGDPFDGGTEVTTGAHERVEVSSDDWDAPVDGTVVTTDVIEFAVPSAAYPDTVTHWAAFKVGDTEPYLGFRLDAPIEVTAAGGTAPTLRPKVQTPESVTGG